MKSDKEKYDVFYIGENNKKLKRNYVDDSNILICGEEKSGKTKEINEILYNMISCVDSNNLNIVIVDPKKQLGFYKGIPHVYKNTIYEDSKEILDVFKDIIKEGNRRKEIFINKNCNDFDEYIKLEESDLKRYFVVIDDFDLIIKDNKEIEGLLTNLLTLTDEGIYVVMSTSKIDSKTILNTYRLLINNIVCLKLKCEEDSTFLLGESGAEKLESKEKIICDFKEINKVESLDIDYKAKIKELFN